MDNGLRFKLTLVIVGFALVGLSTSLVLLSSKKSELDRQLAQTKKLAKKMELDIAALNKEKEGLKQENDKLQADATSYIAINTRVSQEKEKLQEVLEKSQKAIIDKETNIERLKINLQKLEKELQAKKGMDAESGLEDAVKKLEKKISGLEKQSVKDKAIFYYNLGVAYTQAKYYSEAIDSYEKSLKLDSANADAHYNLALIYGNAKEEPAKAAHHYRAYLKLRPNAPDKDEVEALIDKPR